MRRIAQAAMVLLGLGITGCQTTDALGPGGGLSMAPGLSGRVYPTPPDRTWQATREALTDLGIASERFDDDAVVRTVHGTTADGQSVTVSVAATAQAGDDAGTAVRAKFGRFGDSARTRTLMDRISVRLGLRPPEPPPLEPPSNPTPNPIFAREAVPDATMLHDRVGSHYIESPF